MATKASLSHLERTAEEPRDNTLQAVKLTKITEINPTIRLFQLTPTQPNTNSISPPPPQKKIPFKPGQWLDVFCPSIPKAGGFTITSPPSLPYLELAIQQSPANPPAAWLWRPEPEILGQELNVRVGGSFCWPPKGIDGLKRAVFVAGGVGINPLISIVSFVAEEKERKGRLGFRVVFLYSTKDLGEGKEGDVLFLDRLRSVFGMLGDEGKLKIFLTGGQRDGKPQEEDGVQARRIDEEDLFNALGSVEERQGTVAYICGIPGMTDEFVDKTKKAEGMKEENVLCEKWW